MLLCVSSLAAGRLQGGKRPVCASDCGGVKCSELSLDELLDGMCEGVEYNSCSYQLLSGTITADQDKGEWETLGQDSNMLVEV